MANEIEKGEKGIKKIKVYSTDKDLYHNTGDSWEVAEKLGLDMVKKGLVSLSPVKGNKEDKA